MVWGVILGLLEGEETWYSPNGTGTGSSTIEPAPPKIEPGGDVNPLLERRRSAALLRRTVRVVVIGETAGGGGGERSSLVWVAKAIASFLRAVGGGRAVRVGGEGKR